MSDSVRPRRRQPTRLPRPWDSPGKNTGVGCHFLLQCMKVKSESEVAQSWLTLSDPMHCSPPGSSIHGILQARVLEWGAIAFSEGCSTTTHFLKPSLELISSRTVHLYFYAFLCSKSSWLSCPQCYLHFFIHFSPYPDCHCMYLLKSLLLSPHIQSLTSVDSATNVCWGCPFLFHFYSHHLCVNHRLQQHFNRHFCFHLIHLHRAAKTIF